MSVETGFASLAILVGLLALRIPIGVALLAVGFSGLWLLRGLTTAFGTLGSVPFEFTAHWTLSAVPMFILMGILASRGGLTTALYHATRVWLGHLPGGLAIATTVAGSGFAAICGSSLATTAAMGKIAVPEMLRYKYDKGLATACAAAVGTIGALIPPSIIMVIYAVFAEISVGRMLLAGVLPGALTAMAYIVMIYVRCRINPDLAPRDTAPPLPLREKVASLGAVWPVVMIAVGVVVAIYGGYATATEAGAIGAALTALTVALRGKATRKLLSESALETVTSVASILMIAVGASMLTQFLALTGMPFYLSGLIGDLTQNHTVIILLCCALYLVLGGFLDPLGIMLLTLPILLPIFDAAGINEIWAGVILIKMLEIGLLTPPVGLNVFIMKNAVGDQVPLSEIFRGVSWFLVAEVVVMGLLIGFPEIILAVPNLMR